MIFLHNQHDKASRDFIQQYGEGHTVYDYPECLNYYNTISTFPTIVIDVPAYYQELETEEEMNPEIEEIIIEEPGNREGYIELFGYYEEQYSSINEFYTKAMEFKNMVEERAMNNPPK